MARKVKTEKELGDAIKNEEDEIEIEGDLVSKTIRIRATGKVAWAIAVGAIGIAAFSAYATVGTGGSSAPATLTSGLTASVAASSILGVSTTSTAVYIAMAAGGIGALTSLRKYKEVYRSESKLILRRK